MLLCLETSTTVCSVALTESSDIVAFREVNEGFSHAAKLTVFIAEVLEEAKCSLKDLDGIAVSSGPGSYTGLRIGVSVAKGLCYAADKPLIAVPTLEAMAAGAISKVKIDEQLLFCPMIDARRMEVYCALYDVNLTCIQPVSAQIVTSGFFAEELQSIQNKKIVYFGDGAEKCVPVLNGPFEFLPSVLPSARFMAVLAEKKMKAGDFENVALFEPFYLKEFRAGKKAEK